MKKSIGAKRKNVVKIASEQQRADNRQVGGEHYKSASVTPWMLQKHMSTSGSVFVDARRCDAIKYAFRKKGDRAKMLEDLRKAHHCLEGAIEELERIHLNEQPHLPQRKRR